MNHKKSMRRHVKRRLGERYGIYANRDIYFAIQDIVKNGYSEFLKKQSNTRSLHKISIHKNVLEHHRTTLKCKVRGRLVDIPIDENGYVTIYATYNNKYHELNSVYPWHNGNGEPLSTQEFLEHHNNEHKYLRV